MVLVVVVVVSDECMLCSGCVGYINGYLDLSVVVGLCVYEVLVVVVFVRWLV